MTNVPLGMLARYYFYMDTAEGGFSGGECNYLPWEGAVLDCLLAVLAPPVTVFKVIHLALRQERDPRLSLTLLPLLLPSFR